MSFKLYVFALPFLLTGCVITNDETPPRQFSTDTEFTNSGIYYSPRLNVFSDSGFLQGFVGGLVGNPLEQRAEVKAIQRVFFPENDYAAYLTLIVTNNVHNIESVRAAADAFMCNFSNSTAVKLNNPELIALSAPMQRTNNTLLSGSDMLRWYDFEVARHFQQQYSELIEKYEGSGVFRNSVYRFDMDSNIYLVASEIQINDVIQILEEFNSLDTNLKHEEMTSSQKYRLRYLNNTRIISLNRFTSREVGTYFENLRKHLVGLSIANNEFMQLTEDLQEPSILALFRLMLDYVPKFVSSANANVRTCASD